MPSVNSLASSVSSIQALERFAPSNRPESAGQSFGAFLGQALENLSAIEHRADQAATRLAAGEPVDLHDVLIAAEESSVAFQLALQVRNKAVEAYQEIMRMQV